MLCDEIAAGGMATVHLGRLRGSAGFSRTVAIKRLHAQFAKDPDFVAMFLDEARLAGGIRHPNVVPTLDVLIHEGEILVVMEYVHGESLSRLARAQKAGVDARGSGVPLPIALSIVSGALYGLHAAHEARDDRGAPLDIVHRDVSPQNILVGLDGVVRVVDFGVAKAAGRLQMTREGMLKGKLAYMAPEQAAADTVDRRCDIYSAAVVLWEALTGQRLFTGQNEMSLFRSVLAGAVTPPSALVPGLPPEVDALVMRGLAREPADRFATALEMAEAAQRIAYATPGQVGTWVRALGGEALDQRAARVASIERTWAADAPALPDLAPDSTETPRGAVTQPQPPPAFANASASSPTRPTAHLHPVAAGVPLQSYPAPPAQAQPVPPAPNLAPTMPLPPHLAPLLRPATQALAPQAVPPADVASQIITSLNIAAPPPRRPSRAPIVLALTAPLALVVIGGGIAIWRASARDAAPAPRRPGRAGDVVVRHATRGSRHGVGRRLEHGRDPPRPGRGGRDRRRHRLGRAREDRPAATGDEPTRTSGAPSGGKAGCNPPYTVDARGVRVPKMECL